MLRKDISHSPQEATNNSQKPELKFAEVRKRRGHHAKISHTEKRQVQKRLTIMHRPGTNPAEHEAKRLFTPVPGVQLPGVTMSMRLLLCNPLP